MKRDSLYTILGITPEATTEEIKQAYRQKAFELHPDRNPGADVKMFHKAREAYETLSNPLKRKLYDACLNSTFSRKMKKDKSGSKTGNKNSNDSSIIHNVTLFVSAKELHRGAVLPIHFRGKSIQVRIPERSYDGRKLIYLTEIEGKSLKITVALSLKPGNERVAGNGNVYMGKTIDSNMAALGGKIDLITPLGETVTVTLRGGHRNGQMIRLKGTGLSRKSGERGDLFITLNIKRVYIDIPSIFSFRHAQSK